MADPVRIAIRRDSTVNWQNSNPILGAGEPALDTTTGALRIGDGVSPYSDLPVFVRLDPTTQLFPSNVRSALAAALTNPSTPEGAAVGSVSGVTTGYDIVILAGQSNMSGRGTPFSSTTDPVNASVFQFNSQAPNANTIQPASEPLSMHDTATGIGPGLQFARWYAARALGRGRKVLLVPVAHGGTPLSSAATLAWRRGVSGNLYANMIAQTSAALSAAGAGSRVVGALWVQGETDGDNSTTGSQYQTDLDALIAGLRTDLSITDLPFVIGTMVPDYLPTGTRAAIDIVHRDTPNRLARVDVAVGPRDMNMGDGNHYNAAGQRINGRLMYEAYERIVNGVAPYQESQTNFALGATSPAQVYSLRKVGTKYTGKAIRVRRSSDSATLDIGFTLDGGLDVPALLGFVQSGDGFVATWYDQSGSGRNITQATAASQPKIVSAGALITSGGKPAVSFDGSASVLFNSSPVLFPAGAATVLQVLSSAIPTANARVWAESLSTITSGASGQYALLQPDSTTDKTYSVLNGATVAAGVVPYWTNTIRQASAVDAGASVSSWVDGAVDLAAASFSRGTMSPDRFAVGGLIRNGSLAAKAMLLSEMVTFTRALSDTDRVRAAANQRSFYGTP